MPLSKLGLPHARQKAKRRFVPELSARSPAEISADWCPARRFAGPPGQSRRDMESVLSPPYVFKFRDCLMVQETWSEKSSGVGMERLAPGLAQPREADITRLG